MLIAGFEMSIYTRTHTIKSRQHGHSNAPWQRASGNQQAAKDKEHASPAKTQDGYGGPPNKQ